METRLHIPACWRMGWREDRSSATRMFMLRQHERPVEISVSRETPKPLRELMGDFADGRRLNVYGQACFAAMRAYKPRFQRFARPGHPYPYLSEGATIVVTGRDKADTETIIATWDDGEQYPAILRRLGEARRLLAELPTVVMVEQWVRPFNPELPPPAILLSVTSSDAPDEIERQALGGCAAGACPIAIAAGRRRIDFVFDHRLYDYADEKLFAQSFMDALENRLAGDD